MSQSSKRKPVVMGLFIAIALVILAGGIILIGGSNELFTQKLRASVVFDDVNGLKEGDNVWFSGVPVGVVSGVDFEEGATVRVSLKIDEEAAEHIAADSLAKVGSDGLIGNRIVVIYEGSPGAARISEGAELTAGEAVSTEDILATLQANNENLLAITTDMKTVTARLAEGEGTAGRLLADEDLYTRLDATVGNMEQVAANAQGLTASLEDFAGELNQPGNLPHDLVTDQTTYDRLLDTVARLDETSDEAAELVEGLAENTQDTDTPVGALLSDEAAGADLKATLDNLNTSSALLAKELDALQYSFLLRGPLKKREKAREKAREEAREEAQAEERAEARAEATEVAETEADER